MKNSPSKPIFRLEKHQYYSIGIVPIRRTTKDDLIRDESLLTNHTLIQNSLINHVSFVFV